MLPENMTYAEAAEYLRVSVATLKRWVRAGKIPTVKIGRRVVLRKVSLDAVLAQHEQRRQPPAPAKAPEPKRA